MFTKTINARWRAVIAGLFTIVAVSLISTTAPIQHLESMASDFTVYRRKLPRPTGTVVIAAIDEPSIAELGRWPWSRTVEARLVDALRDYHVAVIGFDMLFSEKESDSSDREFARAMAAQRSTYIGYYLNTHVPLKDADWSIYKSTLVDPTPVAYNLIDKLPNARPVTSVAGGYLPPISELNRAAAGTSFLNIDEDSDGIIRSYPTVVRFNGLYCVPLFLALADAYLHKAPLRLELAENGIASVALGDHSLPVDQNGQVTLHFRGPAGSIPRYSISDIVNRRIPPGDLASKVVVIGVTALGVGDLFVTPVGRDFPGVEVLATAVDNALAGDFLHHSLITQEEEELAALFLGLTITFVAAFANAGISLAVMLALIAGYLGYAMMRLSADGVIIGLVRPCVTVAITYVVVVSVRYIAEGRRGQFLARFLSPQLARSVLERGLADTMRQKRVQLSVVACDLRGFTAFAETAAPEDVIQFLREYYDTIGRVVTNRGGSILSFAGDGIMSLVGAPTIHADHANRAVRIGLEIWREFSETMERWDKLGLRVGLGVGIASGFVTVGTIASSEHLEYTAVGPAVNLAARLSSHAESGQILVDHRTVGLVGENELCRFESVGSTELKGFARRVELFIALAQCSSPARLNSAADASRS